MKALKAFLFFVFLVILNFVANANAGQVFNANEWQVDLLYQGRGPSFNDIESGGGVGVNYFPWRSAGFGFEAKTFDTEHAFFDRLGLSLIGRLPVDKLRIAPEFRIGFDYDLERARERNNYGPDGGFDVYASVGAELRLTKHLGVGAEVRGVRPVDGPQGEHILGILRARLSF